jgi:ABC-type transport system involved in multi-copper enzyme maturation permease subunit
MDKVATIATTTLRELLREKVFMVALVFALVLQLLTILLGSLSISEQLKIVTDFGFLAIHLALLGSSFFFGSYLISKEIEKQTCLLILSRPVSRTQFLLGKMLGVLFLNTILELILAGFLSILISLWDFPQQVVHFLQIGFGLWIESCVILCLVVCLSMLVRPLLALSGGFVFFLLGHGLENIKFFAEKSQDAIFLNFARALEWLSPNFYRINWKSYYFLVNGIDITQFQAGLLQMFGWAGLLFLFANFFFGRKDIV